MELISKKLVFDENLKTEQEVLKFIAQKLKQEGRIKDEKFIFEALEKREKEETTNLGSGFAICHCRNSNVEENSLGIVRLKEPIYWGSEELAKIDFALFIVLNDKSNADHLSILSTLSQHLIDENFINKLKGKSEDAFQALRNAVSSSNKKSNSHQSQSESGNKNKNAMKVVAVTTCPTGVAHTHMAAEALIKEAKSQGIDLIVERQAAEGVVNELSENDIKNADYVLIAAGKAVDKSRFVGKQLLEVPVQQPIKDAAGVFSSLRKNATIQQGGNFSKNPTNKKSKNLFMNGLLTGVSYMIPVVVAGGILLALGFGLGSAFLGCKPNDITNLFPKSLWAVLINIGGYGLGTIMPIVLGGFVAYGIADRAGIAPAMIMSYAVVAGQTVLNPDGHPFQHNGHPVISNPILFDWFHGPAFGLEYGNLGFLGALTVGVSTGYLCLWLKKTIKLPKAIQTIVPIIVIPLLATLIIWALMAFILGLPLSYVARGLDDGIYHLINEKLIFLVTMILGAMICFDLGGPINKTAMLIAIGNIATYPQLMGANGPATAIPPLGLAMMSYMKKIKLFGLKYDANEAPMANSAFALSFFGITEGSLPFVIKNPKLIIANILGGISGGAVAGLFQVTNNAGHGGVIVYLVGAVGKDGTTNYGYGLFYLLALAVGGVVVAVSGLLIEKFWKAKKTLDIDTSVIFAG